MHLVGTSINLSYALTANAVSTVLQPIVQPSSTATNQMTEFSASYQQSFFLLSSPSTSPCLHSVHFASRILQVSDAFVRIDVSSLTSKRSSCRRSRYRSTISTVRPTIIMSATINLNCWIHDEGPGRIFPVEIAATKTVGALKKAIKRKEACFRTRRRRYARTLVSLHPR